MRAASSNHTSLDLSERCVKIKQTRVRTGQFKTSLLEAGREGEPVLFLIHDGALGGCAHTSWERLVPELENEFHIFAPDLFGFGDSDMVFEFGRRPYESHIEQIATIAHILGLETAHFVGASYGGSLLLRAVAGESCGWPMKSGISISGAGGVFRHESGKKVLAETQPTRESIRDCLRLLVDESWAGFEENAERRYRYSLRPGHWETLYSPRLTSPVAWRESLEPDDYPASLSACEVPVLIMEGTKDVLLEEHWAERLARHSERLRSLRLDVGHSPNLDHPQLVADVVRKFVWEHEESLRQASCS
jgi:pimeloyl-ACP methyl ester carboxylesterase